MALHPSDFGRKSLIAPESGHHGQVAMGRVGSTVEKVCFVLQEEENDFGWIPLSICIYFGGPFGALQLTDFSACI